MLLFHYAQSENLASQILLGLPSTAAEYTAQWNNSINSHSKHVLWAFDSQTNPNYPLQSVDRSAGDIFYINGDISFQDTDIRARVSQFFYEMSSLSGQSFMRPLLGKYKSNIDDLNERMIALYRSAEPYFILIESQIEQGKLTVAQSNLAQFLQTMQAPAVAHDLSQDDLRKILRLEKQKEFVGEKINYFDLKRWQIGLFRQLPDNPQNQIEIAASDYRWTWPIPHSEIRHNDLIQQNPNWRSLN